MKTPFLLLLAILASVIAQPTLEAASPTVIYLVRHAEKASVPLDDPLLTVAGTKRAKALAVLMAGKHPAAAFHTQFRRTRDTARPTVEQLAIPAIVIVAGADAEAHAKAVVARIRKAFAGRTVLVVGHTNTIPAIIRRLGITPAPTIQENQFNRLFVVTKSTWSQATMVETTYGP